jgi:hypothetical protein
LGGYPPADWGEILYDERILSVSLRIEAELRQRQSALADIYLALPPALVASCFGFASKIVIGVLLFTFKNHKKILLNFLLTIGNRCVGNSAGY